MKTKILLIVLLSLSLAACGGRRREQPTEAPAATAIVAPTQAPALATATTGAPATEAPTATLVVQPTEAVPTQVAPTESPATLAPTVAADQSDPQGDSLEAQLDQLVNQNATDESNVNNLNP